MQLYIQPGGPGQGYPLEGKELGMSRQTVSFSGGKDSTAMLLMMLERGEQVDEVFFFDGGWEFPEMYEHVSLVEERTGMRITRVHPPHPFDYYMFDHVKVKGKHKGEKGYGWPFPHVRWCTGIKRDCLNRESRNGDVQCVGLAKGEEKRAKAGKRYPLIEWGVTEDEALRYCKDLGYDWGGLYDRYDRLSCWCCPCQSLRDLRNLYEMRPEMWDKLKEMDGRAINDFKHRYPLEDLEERFRKELGR